MTAPIPALSTSADVEAVRSQAVENAASRLDALAETMVTTADDEGTALTAAILKRAATIVRESAHDCTCGHPVSDHNPEGCWMAGCGCTDVGPAALSPPPTEGTPSVPGAVGAGSAVDWHQHRLDKYGSTLDRDNVRHVIERIADYPEIVAAAIAQDADRPELPFTLRMPTNSADNPDGVDLNTGTYHVDVQVIHDPTMEKRGECRTGYGGPVIALREWDEQVFLHELLHAATGYSQPLLVLTHPPHGHEVISRVEVALWETGWRFRPTQDADRTGSAEECGAVDGWICTLPPDHGAEDHAAYGLPEDPPLHTWSDADTAARTSEGGALTEDERRKFTANLRQNLGYAISPIIATTLCDRVDDLLAARAARPTPDDQAEGERDDCPWDGRQETMWRCICGTTAARAAQPDADGAP